MSIKKIEIPDKKPELSKDDIDKLHDFYTVERTNGQLKNIHLDRLKIVNKLREMGYLRYDLPDGNSQYVYVHDNIIEFTTDQKIIDAFEDYIKKLPVRTYESVAPMDDGGVVQITINARMIQEVLYKNLQSYFVLDRLRPDRPITLMSDTKTEKYFYFQNTVVRVTPDDIELVPYSHLEHKIWAHSVIKRPITIDDGKGDFEKFIEDIAGTDDKERKKSLMSILGYLMHDFYECDLRAAFFTDVNKDTAGKAAGGTGKGIIGKALGEMLNHDKGQSRYVAIAGKNLQLEKDTRYCLADMTTQLIHLEDVYKKSFDLKLLYNDITDGASIRKPYQIKPIVRYVKMMISINHTIELEGSSDLRRLIIFELANYYNDKFRPIDKFGKRFFESEWTATDWNRFYTFMCRCALTYLHDGLIDPGEVNYSERRLAESVNEDFRYWFDELISPALIDNERREFAKNSLFEIFTTKYPAYSDKRFRNPFTKWCKKFCELKHIPYVEKRSTNDMLIINPTREDFLTIKK